uniref:ERO1-like protein beta n=1 Tax=Aceria tosichella TaxID=561515 RepID=A0A6G1S9X5_9ACAR
MRYIHLQLLFLAATLASTSDSGQDYCSVLNVTSIFSSLSHSPQSHLKSAPVVSKQDDIAKRLGFDESGFMERYSHAHQFNRNMFLPLVKSIVTMDYFRYVKINLNRPCALWCNADKCNLRDCQVKTFSDPDKCPISSYEDSNELATVNTELGTDQLDLLTNLFECNDNDDHDAQYVDLLLNPERFTGYSGESAHRIWRAIYEENCFVTKPQSPFEQELCYEERLFYEAISGLHTSINLHLCAEYPSNAMIGSFEPNVQEFIRRFENHNDYIENLYKLYFMELRALARCKPYLMKRVNWPDSSTKNAISDLLKVVEKFNIPLFQDFSLKPSHVSHQLAIHFRNITTTIIDCVACDKCKLWGKIQLRGLGTAFKILSVKDLSKFHLNHPEISSLVNALARLSHSIRNLEEFRDLLRKSHQHKKRLASSSKGDKKTATSNDCKSHVDLFEL